MGLLVKLAWRNVWRNRRRSVITILAVTFALMLTVATRGLQLGTYELNIRNVARLYSGYLQIQRPGYLENPTLRASFPYTERLRETLRGEPLVEGFAPRIQAYGLVHHAEKSFGVTILALDPALEPSVSDLFGRIRKGRAPRPGAPDEILVGEDLMRILGASLGDSLVLLAQGFDGFLRDAFFTVVGAYRTGSEAFDRSGVIMPLEAAADLLGMGDRVSVVALSLRSLDDIPRARRRLARAVEPLGLRVVSWDEVVPSFKQSIELDNVGGILFLAILVVVVAFGILNTVLMGVTERFREFGVVLAMGMPQATLVAVVALEVAFLLLSGILLGNLLGAGICWYFREHPIRFSGEFAAIYEEYGFLPLMVATLKARIFLNSTLSIAVAGLVAALYPLWKVARLEPLKGIRYT
jgi:ABC-type lipoprotein release transport system permease subunit